MSKTTVQRLVAAQRASPLSTRRVHSLADLDTQTTPLSRRNVSHRPQTPQESSSSLSLLSQIREARPAVRYTVYAGLGLMATAETTFWFNVIRAKYFPSKDAEEQQKAVQLLEDLRAVVKGYRAIWLRNYNRYHSAYIWGVGYGGLDGLQ